MSQEETPTRENAVTLVCRELQSLSEGNYFGEVLIKFQAGRPILMYENVCLHVGKDLKVVAMKEERP